MSENKMLTMRYDITNRSDRRLAEKEYLKISKALIGVEEEFIKEILGPHENEYYSPIYNWFLNRYIENVDWINVVIKPKFWDVNEYYFSNQYKPIEKTHEDLPRLLRLLRARIHAMRDTRLPQASC